MFKFFGNRWFTVIGAGSFALGIPGALDGFRIWGDWLSFMSGTPSTVAVTIGGMFIFLWLLSKSLDWRSLRRRDREFLAAMEEFTSSSPDHPHTRRLRLLRRLGHIGLGAPHPKADDEFWDDYERLMMANARDKRYQDAKEFGQKVKGMRE